MLAINLNIDFVNIHVLLLMTHMCLYLYFYLIKYLKQKIILFFI